MFHSNQCVFGNLWLPVYVTVGLHFSKSPYYVMCMLVYIS